MVRSLSAIALLTLLIAGCGGTPALPVSTSAVGPSPSPYAGPTSKTRILDVTTGWPRRVDTPHGVVTITAKPQRIHTLSVGFDEITFRLVDPSRIIAISTSTTNPDISNVADLAAAVPLRVGRNAEQVLAAKPDLVVAPPTANADLVRALETAGLTVVLADLLSGVDAHEPNIRLLAYVYGEEARGEQLIAEVRSDLAAVDAVVATKATATRPRVLMLSGKISAAGAGSNEDGIIRRAGGMNVAADAGINGNKDISVEAIPAMSPDVIVLAESDPRTPVLRQLVIDHPALQELAAIKNGRVALVPQRYLTTLSHWNVRGVQELARILYPADFR
jgi:iron complex transport system substrate-binding protein